MNIFVYPFNILLHFLWPLFWGRLSWSPPSGSCINAFIILRVCFKYVVYIGRDSSIHLPITPIFNYCFTFIIYLSFFMKSFFFCICKANNLIHPCLNGSRLRLILSDCHSLTFLRFFKCSRTALSNSKEAKQHLVNLVSYIAVFSISSVSSIVGKYFSIILKDCFLFLSNEWRNT